jgi:hypothetical protein
MGRTLVFCGEIVQVSRELEYKQARYLLPATKYGNLENSIRLDANAGDAQLLAQTARHVILFSFNFPEKHNPPLVLGRTCAVVDALPNFVTPLGLPSPSGSLNRSRLPDLTCGNQDAKLESPISFTITIFFFTPIFRVIRELNFFSPRLKRTR